MLQVVLVFVRVACNRSSLQICLFPRLMMFCIFWLPQASLPIESVFLLLMFYLSLPLVSWSSHKLEEMGYMLILLNATFTLRSVPVLPRIPIPCPKKKHNTVNEVMLCGIIQILMLLEFSVLYMMISNIILPRCVSQMLTLFVALYSSLSWSWSISVITLFIYYIINESFPLLHLKKCLQVLYF